MATGVFGVPVTKETLIATGMYPDPSKITQRDLAKYAETMSTADGRDKDALNFVESLKRDYGKGVSALFVFYNATGGPLQFIDSNNWHGHCYKHAPPTMVENGQWGAFLHVHPRGATVGSSGAVVYRDHLYSDAKDWLLSWTVPWVGANRVYTEIREKDHWPKVGTWDHMYHAKLLKSGKHSVDEQSGRRSDMQLPTGTSPEVRAILTLL